MIQTYYLIPQISSVVSVDTELVAIFSWVAMPSALIFSMLVVVVENIRLGTNIRSARKRDLKKLSNEFDDLGGDDDD
jgi:hypothetical protein